MSPTRTMTTTAIRRALSRRVLLKRLGASAALLPLLEADRPARAATPPRRLVTLVMTNGVVQSSFYPAGDSDPTAAPILKPLEKWKSKLLIPAGLDVQVMFDLEWGGAGHGTYPAMFTGTFKVPPDWRMIKNPYGTATGPSIHRIISDAVAKKVTLPLPIVDFVMMGGSTVFLAGEQKNTPEKDTRRLFDKMFASQATAPEQLAALRARRKSVFDFVRAELQAFGARLGTEDRRKIEGHMDAVRTLEMQLAPSAERSCARPSAPAGGAVTYGAIWPPRWNELVGLVATALRCDLTRVVAITLADDGGSAPDPVPVPGMTNVNYHGTAHTGSAEYATKAKIDTWFFERIAELVGKLDEASEGGGSVLDSTAVVIANDMASGENHSVAGIPIAIVGSCGGHFRTGRVVRLGSWAGKTGKYWGSRSGVPHNKLLVELCNAMGVPTDKIGSYGGTLPELRAPAP